MSEMKRSRGRPKTQSDDERRKAIVDEARRTFVELGYRGTTTDIVAARCHISKQTIYRVFESKADLFLAVVGSHRRMMLALPRPEEEDRPIDEALQDIFMIDIDEAAEREREAFIFFVMQESAQVPELGDILRREGMERSRGFLAEWLDIQVARKKIAIDDTLSGARMLMDLLFGGLVGPASRDWKNREDRNRHLRRCIDVFVRGVQPS
ncbi:TetR/AcrR family transcriptional regulator [Aliirhizobium smilacinae]|uniref:TetR/AcrR family transcriptional regulator n=1 Tax=Aliirhizobium smilacinae TaxID=1395944 RepID=A0A5C4XKP0_9HYPH|nr:TetR/AcrR family transcriptional regulator [Rhizobium smilacinae]TNM63918.1 TetR/AcrR family transcriptional regulator [Rhizobium smilacinae]